MPSRPSQRLEIVGSQRFPTIREERDRRVAAIASKRHDLISLADLRAIGFSQGAVAYRARTGRLHRVHPGLFCTHPPPLGWEQRIHAAVIACGAGAAASHLFAANLLTLVESRPAGPIDISGAGQRGRSLDGIRSHRVPLLPRDRTGVDGIPCTAAARTLADIAPLLGEDALEDALIAADSLRILNRGRLDELIAQRAGRPGISRLAGLIADDPVETRHLNERRMFSICREFGITRPLTDHRIEAGDRTFYADFCWPDQRLIVEFDSWRWHGGRTRTEQDRDRDQRLAVAGWHTVRFTRDQVVHQREQTGNRLVALTTSEV